MTFFGSRECHYPVSLSSILSEFIVHPVITLEDLKPGPQEKSYSFNRDENSVWPGKTAQEKRVSVVGKSKKGK